MCSLNVSKGICGQMTFLMSTYIYISFPCTNAWIYMYLHVGRYTRLGVNKLPLPPPPKNCITLETVEFKFEYTIRYFSHPFQRTLSNFAILTNCNFFCRFQMVHMLEGNIFKEFTCSDWFKVLLRVKAP